jgi:hypothetical protein
MQMRFKVVEGLGDLRYAVTLDPDFAAHVEEIVRNRKPWNPPTWD